MKLQLVFLQLLIVLITASAINTFPQTIYNQKEGFTITLPHNWVQLSKDSIKGKKEFENVFLMQYDFLYKITDNNKLNYPYIQIQCKKDDDVVGSNIFRMAKIKTDSMSAEYFLKMDNKMVQTKNTKQIWMKETLASNDSIKITSTTVIIPAYRTCFTVHIYMDSNQMNNCIPEIIKIVNSIKVDDKNPVAFFDKNKTAFVFLFIFILFGIPTLLIIFSLLKNKHSSLIKLIPIALGIVVAVFIIISIVSKLLFYFTKSYTAINLISALGLLFLSLFLVYFLSGRDFSSYGFKLCSVWNVIKPILLFYIIVMPLDYCLNIAVHAIGLENASFDRGLMGEYGYLCALIAAIQEEILFRGALQSYLAPLKKFSLNFRFFKLSFPVIITSLLFGCLHFTHGFAGGTLAGGFISAIGATSAGFICGYIREESDSILPGMILHLLINSGIVFIFIYKMFWLFHLVVKAF